MLRSVLNGLQGYVQTRMEQMGQFVNEAAMGQTQLLASMTADAGAFKARKGGDHALLRDQVCYPQRFFLRAAGSKTREMATRWEVTGFPVRAAGSKNPFVPRSPRSLQARAIYPRCSRVLTKA